MALDVGLLILRLAAGLMMLGHGVGKVADLFAGKTGFPDPLGVGPTASLALAAFSEFVCAALVALGLLTRLASVPVVITMLVAALVIHAGDPWGDKEFPLLYAAAFLTLVFTGGGRFAVDALWSGKRRRRR